MCVCWGGGGGGNQGQKKAPTGEDGNGYNVFLSPGGAAECELLCHVLNMSASTAASGQDHWPGLGEEGPRTLHRGAEPLRP